MHMGDKRQPKPLGQECDGIIIPAMIARESFCDQMALCSATGVVLTMFGVTLLSGQLEILYWGVVIPGHFVQRACRYLETAG